jgi:hypothetical protein
MGTDGGLYMSNNRGGAWSFVANLPLAQFYHVSVDMDVPYNLYGGLQDNSSWRGPSESGGIENKDWTCSGGDGFATPADARDPPSTPPSGGVANASTPHRRSGHRRTPTRARRSRVSMELRLRAIAHRSGDDLHRLAVSAASAIAATAGRISPDLTTND